MMWQFLITGLIVFGAIVYMVFRVMLYFSDPLRKCSTCSSSCEGCPLKR